MELTNMRTEPPMGLTAATLDELAQEHGDSFYLVDLDAFEANYREFLGAFRILYPNTTVAYSYKTNYLPRLCEMVDQWGGRAEVVSRMEYDLALRLGVHPNRIVFNGPYKSRGDIELALRMGSVVNLDWPYQVDMIAAFARSFPGVEANVGLRVTFAVPFSAPSRFGFAAGDELQAVFDRLSRLGNVKVAGLHCHFLTLKRSFDDYRFIADRMLAITTECFAASAPEFINVGGGYFSRMKRELQVQFGIDMPTYEQYAAAIATQVAERYPDGRGPELIVEPGIALIADAVKFAARVIDVHASGSRKQALVTGSVYDIKPTLNHRNLPVTVVSGRRAGGRSLRGKLDIVGYTCMERDVLFAGYEGNLAVGDHVIFDNVGAYTNVLRPPFIQECPAMLGWSSRTGAFELLKRREVFDDVFRTYRFGRALSEAAQWAANSSGRFQDHLKE